MNQDDMLTTQFETNRARLRALAYRMLGSRGEAEDAVQEAWLRLAGTSSEAIDNLGGWLTTVTARVCLDRLRSRASRPEDPRDVDGADDVSGPAERGDPADHAVLAESIGAALLVVLDALAPAERVAFVLHDVFAVPFEEISEILERSPDATRQLASRARRRVQGRTTSSSIDPARHRQVVNAFLAAARGGDFDALVRLLDPNVALQPDAAALRMGSLREMRGAAQVAAAMSGGARGARLAVIEGLTGFVWAPAGDIRGVVQFVLSNGRIERIDVTGDPQRIAELDIVLLD